MLELSKTLQGTRLADNYPPTQLDPDAISVLRGTCCGSYRSFSLSEDTLSKHLLVLGGIGMGKSTIIHKILNDVYKRLSNNDVIIVFDSKGDYYKKLYDRNAYMISNSISTRQYSYRWNLFDEVLADGDEPENYEINVRELASVLFDGRGSQTQPFFVNAARDLFSMLTIIFIREYNRTGSTFPYELNNADLLRFFQKILPSPQLLIGLLSKYPDAARTKTYLGDASSDQALGILAELNNMLSDFFVGVFASADKRVPEFSMRSFVKRKGGRIVFIEYDLASGDTFTPVYRLLIDLALKEALGRSDTSGNVWLVADEFKLLPRLKHIDDALNFGRSLGVKIIAGLQNISQLNDGYGKDRASSIVSGFSSIIAFYVNDSVSREFLTQYFGENFICYEYLDSRKETIVKERNGHTVENWDLLELRAPGDAVIGLSGCRPFRFHFEL